MPNITNFMKLVGARTVNRRYKPHNRCPPYYGDKYLIPGFKHEDVELIPIKKDWSRLGAVTPPIEQGDDGICYGIAATAAMESANFIYGDGKLRRFAVRDIMDHDFYNGGREGGRADTAFDMMTALGGAILEKDYPLRGAESATPTFMLPRYGDKILGHQVVPQSLYNVLQALSRQPIVGSCISSHEFEKFEDINGKKVFSSRYEPIVDRNGNVDRTEHNFLYMGYDIMRRAVKIKNSWLQWGQGGYGYISFDVLQSFEMVNDCTFPYFEENLRSLLIRDVIDPKELRALYQFLEVADRAARLFPGSLYDLFCESAIRQLKANGSGLVTTEIRLYAIEDAIADVATYGRGFEDYERILGSLISAFSNLRENLKSGIVSAIPHPVPYE